MLASFASDHPYRVMPAFPQPARYRPPPSILDLGDRFYDPVEAARFPATRLRFRNDRAAATVGPATLSDAQWKAHFDRFDSRPQHLAAPPAHRKSVERGKSVMSQVSIEGGSSYNKNNK